MGAQERTGGSDPGLSELAERQHGVVGRRQIEALGVTRREIGRRLETKRLQSLHRGVYAVGHKALTQRSRWLAAVLACGPGAVLSHHTAAALWGIRDPRRGPIDVAVASKARSSASIRRHFSRLPSDEVTVEDGIPVTTAPRTIFDLASVSAPHVVESALRQFEHLRLYDSLSLWDLLERYPRHRGNRAVRIALKRGSEAPGHTASMLEERFLPFLDRFELPRPQLNAWIFAGDRRFKVDCLWPAQRQIVELDSWQAHGTRTAFREDKERDRTLRVHGYGVTRLAWSQLDDEPDEIAADLRVLLAQPSERRQPPVSSR